MVNKAIGKWKIRWNVTEYFAFYFSASWNEIDVQFFRSNWIYPFGNGDCISAKCGFCLRVNQLNKYVARAISFFPSLQQPPPTIYYCFAGHLINIMTSIKVNFRLNSVFFFFFNHELIAFPVRLDRWFYSVYARMHICNMSTDGLPKCWQRRQHLLHYHSYRGWAMIWTIKIRIIINFDDTFNCCVKLTPNFVLLFTRVRKRREFVWAPFQCQFCIKARNDPNNTRCQHAIIIIYMEYFLVELHEFRCELQL